MPDKITTGPLTNFDVVQALDVVWEALGAVRENLLPEGDESYDAQWNEITTAMSWIEEALGVPERDDVLADAMALMREVRQDADKQD